MNFGSRITEQRKLAGLSQSDLADRCGVSREMWGKYERGIATPGGEVLAKAGIAGLDVRYILLGEFDPAVPRIPPLPADERKLLKRYRALGEVQRKQALDMLQVLALGGAMGGHTNIVKPKNPNGPVIGSIHGGTQHMKPDEP